MKNSSDFDALNLEQLFGEDSNSSSDFLIKDSKKESDYYTPSPKNAKNGKNYLSTIKFIKNPKNPSRSFIKKWVIYLENSDQEKKYIDCPSTVNKPSILQDMFFALSNSDDAMEKKLSKNFGRRAVYFSLVMIMEDENRPDLVGKIKIFKFGEKLYNQIEKITNGNEAKGIPGHALLSYFDGKGLDLDVKIVKGFNNYDDSAFTVNACPIKIDGKAVKNVKENWPLVAKYVLDNSPDFSQVEYKEWDDATIKFILDTIEDVVPNTRIIEKIYKKHNINSSFKTSGNSSTVVKNSNRKLESIEDDEDSESELLTAKRRSVYNNMKSKSQNLNDDSEGEETLDEVERIMNSTNKESKKRTESKEIDIEDESIYDGL